MIQPGFCASTPTPIVWPRYQPFGSGFGHIGSTSKRGACVAPLAWASTRLWSTSCPAPSASSNASSDDPMNRLRFMTSSPGPEPRRNEDYEDHEDFVS